MVDFSVVTTTGAIEKCTVVGRCRVMRVVTLMINGSTVIRVAWCDELINNKFLGELVGRSF